MGLVKSRSARSLGLAWLVTLVASCGGGPGGPAALPAAGSVTTAAAAGTTVAPATSEAVSTTTVVTGVSVSVTAADGQAVSALVGVEGGMLIATSGAVTYTLMMPAGAVQSPVEVSMTPIVGLDGSPFDGPVAGGVVLAPEGLVLVNPALLTVAGGPPAEGAAGFGFRGSGEGFHLVPLVPGEGVVVPVRHFSGYGYGVASEAFWARAVAMDVADGFDRVEHEVAEYLATYHDTYGDAGDPDRTQRFEDWAAREEQLATDALTIAANDPLVLGSAAVFEVLGVARELQLLGIDAEFPEAALRAFLDTVDTTLDALCAAGAADPLAVVQAILASERARQLLGSDSHTSEQVMARVDRCRFTISVHTAITWHGVNAVLASVASRETHDMVLTGPLTPLVFEASMTSACENVSPLGSPPNVVCLGQTFPYRWTADIVLTVSDFTSNGECWTGGSPLPFAGFEPTLHVDITPDLNATQILAPKGQATPPPASSAVVTIDLRKYVVVPQIPGDGINPCSTTTDADGIALEDSWAAVDGAAPTSVPFGIGTVDWTRQSPPGTTQSGSPLGYYKITTNVAFTTTNSPPAR